MPFLFAIILLISSNAYAGSVVEIARSQLGQGEIGGNNRGETVKKYTKGQEVSWCAGFVSWCKWKAGKNTPYFLAAKSYWDKGVFQKVKRPRKGDIIVFRRRQGGHVGIVENVNGSKITTIEGNVGPYPAKVKRMTYTLGSIKNLLGFVRI